MFKLASNIMQRSAGACSHQPNTLEHQKWNDAKGKANKAPDNTTDEKSSVGPHATKHEKLNKAHQAEHHQAISCYAFPIDLSI